MNRLWPLLAGSACVALVLTVPIAQAVSQQVSLSPGDSLTVTCSTSLTGTIGNNSATLSCAAAPTPTATPTATPSAGNGGSGVGLCGESNDLWHPPVVNGCATSHEHGDAPPDWVTS